MKNAMKNMAKIMIKNALFVVFISVPLWSKAQTNQVFAPLFATDTITQETVLNREISINASPLLVQIMPFNRQLPTVTGPYNVSFKRYFTTTRALRLSMGATLNPTNSFAGNAEAFLNHFNARVGITKDKVLSEHWYYGSSLNFFATSGDFNVPGNKSEENEIGFGIGPAWEIGYYFTENMSLSTETFLFIGIKSTGFAFQFIPPIALNLNIKFKGKNI
jgi:hypothetical protein